MNDPTEGPPARSRILICEDEIMLAEDIALTLRDLGYDVPEAVCRGEEAILAALELKPDLILMDIKLKGELNGIDAIEQIRGRMDIPVIYLTAYAGKDVLERAKRTEPYGYLGKPVGIAELRSAVEVALYKHDADKRVRESEEKYRGLVERSLDGVGIVRGTNILYANPAMLHMFGLKSSEEALGTSILRFVAPEWREIVEKRGSDRERGEEVPESYECVAQKVDGTRFQVEVRSSLIPFHGGPARQLILSDITDRKKMEELLRKSHDELERLVEIRTAKLSALNEQLVGEIDERRRTEEALKKSEAVFRDVLSAAMDGFCWVGRDGRILEVNEACCKMAGYSRDELTKMKIVDLEMIMKEDQIAARVQHILFEGRDRFETVHRRKDGGAVEVEISAQTLPGETERFFVFVRDITERRKAEDALRRSEEKFHKAFRHAPVMSAITEISDGTYIDVNDYFCEVAGFTREEFIGRTSVEVGWVTQEDRGRIIKELMEKGRVANMEVDFRTRDRRTLHCIYNGELVNIDERQNLLSLVYDISERKKAEENLRQVSDNLEELVKERTSELLRLNEDLRKEIEYRKLAEAALVKSEERLRSIMSSMDDLLFVLDPSGVFIDHFQRRDKLNQLYAPPELFLGSHFRDVLPVQVADLLESSIRKLVVDDGVQGFDYPMEIGQQVYWFAAKASTLRGPNGDIVGFTVVARNISDRKKLEEELEESERLHRTLFELAQDPILLIDIEGAHRGRIIQANGAAAELHGYSLEELLRLDIAHLDGPESGRDTDKRVERILQGESLREEATHRRKDGSLFPIEISARPVEIVGHKYSLAIGRDLTERKKAEDALRSSEDKFRRLVTSLDVGMCICTLDGKFEYVNPALVKITGYENVEELMATPAHRLYADSADGERLVQELLCQGRARGFETIGLRKDGSVRNISLNAVLQEDPNGQPAGMIVVAEDVTARKASELKLRESEQRYRLIFNHCPVGIMHFDGNGVIVDFNDVFAGIMGAPREKILGFNMLDRLRDPQMLMAVREGLEGKIGYYEGDYLSVTGDKVTPMRAVYSRMLDDNGTFLGAVGIFEDASKWKQAERALQASEQRFSTLIETMNEAFGIQDRNGVIAYVNRKQCEMLGYSREELVGKKFVDFFDEESKRAILDNIEKRRQGQSGSYEVRFVRKDGELVDAIISGVPLFDEAGNFMGSFGVGTNITFIKKAEQFIRQADRFRAVADLTSGIAHNFNNLLQIVLGNASLGLMNLQAGDLMDLKENIEQIVKSSELGAETVRRLIRYARGRDISQREPLEVFDLCDMIRQAVEMSKPWWKTAPQMRGRPISLYAKPRGGCTVRGDKNEIFEVLVNLIKNAVEAMPAGGDIEIDAARTDNAVVLRVADSGIGIPQENLHRLFTPFFTTSVEAGRGIGLATCRSIVDAHGGTIIVESVEGKGSTFTVTLPYAPPEPAPSEVREGKSLDRSLTILAVDDLEATVKILSAGLGRLGHIVAGALSGPEALQIFKENHIDLVICDLAMPEMNGWQVSKALVAFCAEQAVPKPPFIMLTGWDDQQNEHLKISESGVDAVIQKPVDMTKLLGVIQEVLGRGGGDQ